MKDKVFNIINNGTDYSLYVYGDIISGTDKWDESDVTYQDFKDAVENIKPNSTLNMYISSGGGSVFATQSMMTLLDRCKKEKKCYIKAHLDALAASCASFLPMISDEIIVYKNTIMMLHKPMSMAYGNVNEMQQTIDLLNKLEDSIMIPAYMSKAKEGITEDKIKDMLAAETWLNAEEICDIFNVTYIDEEKEIAAHIDYSSIKAYKNAPESLKGSFFNAQKTTIDKETQELLDRVNKKINSEEWQDSLKRWI